MKQKLLLSGFVILFPKLIIFLVLTRFAFAIKAIKYSLLCIAFLWVLLVILACISIGAILECCSNRFNESRLILKMILYSLAFLVVLWIVRYSFRNLRKRLDYLFTDWALSSIIIRGTIYKHLAYTTSNMMQPIDANHWNKC